jgi:hypothetical protein
MSLPFFFAEELTLSSYAQSSPIIISSGHFFMRSERQRGKMKIICDEKVRQRKEGGREGGRESNKEIEENGYESERNSLNV